MYMRPTLKKENKFKYYNLPKIIVLNYETTVTTAIRNIEYIKYTLYAPIQHH